MNFQSRLFKLHPAALILATFISAILVGAFLLDLPISISTGHDITWVDAMFTATSAVCVTGLTVVDIGSYFTLFGQWVILCLIQVGGLGVMTISVALFRWFGRSVSFRHRMAMQDLFAHTPREDIFGLVKSIMFFTFGAEALGAVLLSFYWGRELPVSSAVFKGVFHSVSAFCNAGFALFPDNLMSYSGSLLVNSTICGLIVVGGIGFPVLYDLQSWFVMRKKRRTRLSIQTKTVLLTTLFLILAGTFLFAFLEKQALMESSSTWTRLLAPIFQSITCRTAGFNTVDISSLKDATLAMMIFLMFFGASPGSCGGGVKTTTLALLTAFTLSRIRRKRRVNIFRKSIPNETVTRSMSLILISIGIIVGAFFLILVGDSASGSPLAVSKRLFLAFLFEVVSAFGTVGLSTGITPFLDPVSKYIIMSVMIIGRVGVLTFSYIIVGAGVGNGVEYAEENLMVG
jgi:trk system potassium uptake protein